MIQYALLFFSVVWLIAVFKVFILDDGSSRSRSHSKASYAYPVVLEDQSGAISHISVEKDLPSIPADSFPTVTYTPTTEDIRAKLKKYQAPKDSRNIPSSSELMSLKIDRKLPKNVPIADTANSNPSNLNTSIAPSHTLTWPAVLLDGSIPPNEGYDLMPLTGLKVPRFWTPPPENLVHSGTGGIEDVYVGEGRRVKGEETIFLMIASYRDFQCRETITSAFSRADKPERLFIAAVDQIVSGDVGCLDIDIPCSVDPNQMICKYRSQIAVYRMDATKATGPVSARHIGDRMYRGEYFAMQLDAHCQFVRHWDTQIIAQWRETHNEMAVLTSYLTDVQGSFTKDGDSARKTRPIMCNSDFEGLYPARYLRHGSQPEDFPAIGDMPQLQPFWAAGFSFSRGHFVVNVPYDGYQPMVFQGEEIAIGIRGFTFGYDFYAPRASVVFHEYADNSARRKKIHMFWENGGHAGEGQKSLRRATAVIGMAPDVDPKTWDHSEIDKYGLGKVRDLQLFYKLFLIDPTRRKASPLCPFVNPGHMHTHFQPHLRPDGKGLDYSQLVNYDTTRTLLGLYAKQHAYVSKMIREGISARNPEVCEKFYVQGEKLLLHLVDADLMEMAKKVVFEVTGKLL